MGARHPESPQRLRAIEEALATAGILTRLQRVEAPPASREQLLRVHEARYLQHLQSVSPASGTVRLDPDTAMNPHSLEAAQRAAGAVVRATELVLAGEVRSAFCAVRPPGHHARPTAAMGFCIFNNVAVGIAHALAAHQLERVAVVDFDVHHGNGTEEMFRADARVLMLDGFQHPYYPYSGTQTRPGYVPLPLAGGSNGTAYRDAVRERWLPVLKRFRPELIYISAGFDAHRDDPLAHLKLDEDDYGWLTHEVRDIAEAYAGGRIVSTLEGGYNLDALGRSVVAHVRMLADC